jgi:hypothetical protein
MTKGYTVNASPGLVIKSNDRESFRADQAANYSAGVTPSPDASAKRFQRVTAPMNISMLAPQQWLQTAEAVIDWYSAVFRLVFGLGRVNSYREPRGFVTARPSPPTEQPESAPVAPLQSSPVAPAQSVPLPVQASRAPVALRPKRRKSLSTATSRSRSSKTSGVKRGRRAA